MVGRRDTGHRGQGDVRHGSHFKDMHKNPNEHVATCMGPNPNWQLVWPTPIRHGSHFDDVTSHHHSRRAITACHQRALDS